MNCKGIRYFRLLPALVVAAIVTACASMGRPEGGARDVDPPVFVRSNPAPGAVNVTNKRITIDFNENVQIKDVMGKVIISPPQQLNPQISANGKRVTVELKDTLKPNTTYTLDFTDGISDLNEGNEIDGFAFAFSTGENIDSLQISGMVLEAATLEPAQGFLVGVYSNLSDTAITTLPFERITRTNQLGQFTLRNLKEGAYRIYAINDMNRDNHWDRSEDVAFYDVTITPTAKYTSHTDSLKAADGSDSIVVNSNTEYAPNDILLTWFNENYQPLYMTKHERPASNKLYLEFAAPSDSLPVLTVLNGDFAGQKLDKLAVLNASATRDSLEYWFTDSVLIKQDSLLLETKYLRTDSLDQISWTVDTMYFNVRGNSVKKADNKKKKNDEEADTLGPKIHFLELRTDGSKTQDVHLPFYLSAAVPVADFNTDGVHLEVLDDTVWIEVVPPEVSRFSSNRPMRFRVDYEWEPGGKYRFTIDSAAVRDIYGEWNNKMVHEFNVRNENEYSSITFNISGIDQPAIVQLLGTNDQPVAAVPVENGKAIFLNMMPGTYYARLFADRNGNGKYDTGSLLDSIQPEEVYYYPKKIPLKERWDAVQTWDVNELAVDMQKPLDIKKNKPKLKAGEMPETGYDDEEEEDDGFYTPGSINGNFDNNMNRVNRGNNSRFRQNRPR
ncbi:MAG: Ig-like domain-containing protein [Paramuribaculum sp.]|nr:Ig-like domain-containing protein [Paramuribaculum sp.]